MSSNQSQTRQAWTEKERYDEEEQRILDTYEPTPLQESDSDPDDVPSIYFLLQSLENLGLFRLENPHINPQKGEQVKEGYRGSTRHGSKGTASNNNHWFF